MASESIAHEAAIDSEPIRAREIIVKYTRVARDKVQQSFFCKETSDGRGPVSFSMA